MLEKRARPTRERHHGLAVVAEKDQLLGLVAPPAGGIPEVAEEGHGGLGEHVGPRGGAVVAVADAPDAAVLDVPVEAVGGDVLPRGRIEPRGVLDDAAVHVGDVEAAVGALGGIDETAVDVGGAEELLALGLGLLEVDEPAGFREVGAADDVDRGIAEEVVAPGLGGEPCPPIHALPAGRGEAAIGRRAPAPVAEEAAAVRGAEGGIVRRGEGHGISGSEVLVGELAGDLPVSRVEVGADERVAVRDPVEVADVVAGKAPLRPVAGLPLALPGPGGVAVALGVVGDVDVVVEVPEKAGVLVLYRLVRVLPPVGAALVEGLSLVGDAVAVGVAVGMDVEGVALADGDPVAEGEDHAGEVQAIDEDGDLIGAPVAIGVEEALDPAVAHRLGALAGDALHVAAHLRRHTSRRRRPRP